ncbi:hypothetical protein NEOLEDRAFT_1182817 [Neolentinus lepideus HHB14362 ss-1]|uniref:F-box domain-containing protein n=1 Tax=Neolentinus lepideus HHB14362 ss-1 TaxID=1314782 RepID=A0A165NTD3_9AGAM|nr:hypothetical protein NEOLEDRAFT_1182817 [Neolentinus lepideus HHB14362 ss-1]
MALVEEEASECLQVLESLLQTCVTLAVDTDPDTFVMITRFKCPLLQDFRLNLLWEGNLMLKDTYGVDMGHTLHFLSALKRMKMRQISVASIAQLGMIWTNLVELKIKNFDLTPEYVQVLRQCQNIKTCYLIPASPPRIIGQIPSAQSVTLPKLQRLRVCSAHLDALSSLLFPNLRELQIEISAAWRHPHRLLSDIVVETLNSSGCQLRRLRMTRGPLCRSIGDLRQILAATSSLRWLEIEDITSMTFFSGQVVMEALARPSPWDHNGVLLVPKLRNLTLSFGGRSYALPSSLEVERLIASRERVVVHLGLKSGLEAFDIKLFATDWQKKTTWRKTKFGNVVRDVIEAFPGSSSEHAGISMAA